MKTFSARPGDIDKKWVLIDAEGIVLGRLATHVAMVLRGKNKATFTPHMDMGDNVIVINAQKVQMTGNKRADKRYYWHTGYPGGIKHRTAGQILEGKHPERVVLKAIERMLPGGPLEPQADGQPARLRRGGASARRAEPRGDRPRRPQSQEHPERLTMADLSSLEELRDAVAGFPAVEEAPKREPQRDSLGRSYATGKRKDAVARVWIKPGNGKVVVNGKEMNVYFARPVLQMVIGQAFSVAGVAGEFDVMATVKGGGLSGQAGAVKHGISQALTLYEPSLRPALKAAGFLTRDSRVVERKKYGKRKARRSFQFSKR